MMTERDDIPLGNQQCSAVSFVIMFKDDAFLIICTSICTSDKMIHSTSDPDPRQPNRAQRRQGAVPGPLKVMNLFSALACLAAVFKAHTGRGDQQPQSQK